MMWCGIVQQIKDQLWVVHVKKGEKLKTKFSFLSHFNSIIILIFSYVVA